jgi:hypothetical protein
MIGEPSQVETGKYDARETVTVVKLLCEIDYLLTAGWIDPIIANDQPIMSNRSPND